VHRGPITVEGFGRECWNYEQAVKNPYSLELTQTRARTSSFLHGCRTG
jgi:hypothetical protein